MHVSLYQITISVPQNMDETSPCMFSSGKYRPTSHPNPQRMRLVVIKFIRSHVGYAPGRVVASPFSSSQAVQVRSSAPVSLPCFHCCRGRGRDLTGAGLTSCHWGSRGGSHRSGGVPAERPVGFRETRATGRALLAAGHRARVGTLLINSRRRVGSVRRPGRITDQVRAVKALTYCRQVQLQPPM